MKRLTAIFSLLAISASLVASAATLSELVDLSYDQGNMAEITVQKNNVKVTVTRTSDRRVLGVIEAPMNRVISTFRQKNTELKRDVTLKSGKYIVESLWGQTLTNGKVLSDVQEDYINYMATSRDFANMDASRPAPNTVIWGSENSVLSFVGPYVSFKKVSSGYMDGAAHGWAFVGIEAYNLEKKAPANLLDLVDEYDLVRALRADSFIRGEVSKYLGDNGIIELEGSRTLSDIGAIFGQFSDCIYSWPREGVTSKFALVGYDATTKLLGVRIGLPYGCEAARGMLTQIGVQVKPNYMFEYYLNEANQGGGSAYWMSILAPNFIGTGAPISR